MKKIILIISIVIGVFACVKNDERVKNITVDDLKLILKESKNIQLLDVRTPSETSKGIIFDAKQINLVSNDFEEKAIEILDKEEPVYIYCRSGTRSKIAANVLVENGYDVYNVKGGYLEWTRKTKE